MTTTEIEADIELALSGIGQLAGLAKSLRSAQAVLDGLTLVRQARTETEAALAQAKAELLLTTDELTRRKAAGRKLPEAETELAAKASEIAAAEAELARKQGELSAVQAQINEAEGELAARQASIRELAEKVAALAGGPA